MHIHRRPYLAIVIGGGMGRTVDPDGQVLSSFNFEAGQAYYFGPETLSVIHNGFS